MYCKNAYKCNLGIRQEEVLKWGIFNHKKPINKEEVLFELKDGYEDDKYLIWQIDNSYTDDYKEALKILKEIQSSFLIRK
jgi:hypothetical protein